MEIQHCNSLVFSSFSNILILQEKLDLLDENNLEELIQLIKDNFLSSATLVLSVFKSLSIYFLIRFSKKDLYLSILIVVSEKLKEYWNESIILKSCTSYYVLLKCYELGLFSFDLLFEKGLHISKMMSLYFWPELIEKKYEFYQTLIHNNIIMEYFEFSKFKCNNSQEDIERYKIARENGYTNEILPKSIREDNIDLFQQYISETNIDINSFIKISYYETFFNIDSNPNISLIEYSALFGAENIFKFLWGNHATIRTFLPQYAIIGGNSNIIHILEENPDISFSNCLDIAIKLHRNDIFDYLITNEIKPNPQSFVIAIQSNNIYAFMQLISLGYYDMNAKYFVNFIF